MQKNRQCSCVTPRAQIPTAKAKTRWSQKNIAARWEEIVFMFSLSSAIAAMHLYFQIGSSILLQRIRLQRDKRKKMEKADEKKEHW
jgi:hypothetical protein